MKQMNNNKGFTLVELLVAISILGIITIIVLPQLSNIQEQNKQTKYAKYAETMLTSGKLYVDSYSEDLFGYNTSGCVDISYSEMKSRGLLKDIKADGATCSGDDTFVRVWKSNDHYTYETFITCEQNGKEVYSKRPVSATCSNQPDSDGPTIEFTKNSNDWTKGDGLKTTVLIYDDYGMLENTKIKYVWQVNGTNDGDYKTHNFKNKRYAGKSKDDALEFDIEVPQNATGVYKLVVVPVDVRDANGNYQSKSKISGEFKLDNTAPTCGTNNGPAENDWTNSTRQITVNCIDSHSQCKKTSYKSQTYESGTVPTGNLKIYDNVGNENTCTFNVYVDKEAPEMPKDGSIGKVSGSNTTGTIQTPSSPTTDVNNGSGFKEIRYIINNTGTTPKKSDFTSTSLTFSRSCSTTYYAYSVAVDNVGNISSVRKLGSTSDGKNEYSAYGQCSAKCDGGIKTRTNSCALITTGLSTTCNERLCCSSTTVTYKDGNTCTALCGGGTYNQLAYSTYDSTKRCPTFDQSSGGSACAQQGCCSKTTTVWDSWGACDAECGTGTKSRTGEKYSIYDGSYCGEDSDSETCDAGSCVNYCSDATWSCSNTWVNASPSWGDWCHSGGRWCYGEGGYKRICTASFCSGMTASEVNNKWGCSYATLCCGCSS